MAKEPTKAELLLRIASMEDDRRQSMERAEDTLIRAIATVVGNHLLAPSIKHLFYRSDSDTSVQISLDMHEVQP